MTKDVDFELKGLLRDSKTGRGLAGYFITAFDTTHRREYELLGRTVSRLNGGFVLHYKHTDFVLSVDETKQEGGDDVVLVVANRFGRMVKLTDPLTGSDRFGEIVIEIDTEKNNQRPSGPPILDPFATLAELYKPEIAALLDAGITTRQSLFIANLATVAKNKHLPLERMEAFRFHAEMTYVDTFTPQLALALVMKANVKTREQLATTEPFQVLPALQQAQREGPIDPEAKFSSSDVYGWIAQARGYDPQPCNMPMNLGKLLVTAQALTDAVAYWNPGADIVPVADLVNEWSRHNAISEVGATLVAAGVTDLSALGTIQVEGQRVIEPGYYIAHPRSTPGMKLDTRDLSSTMVEWGQRFKRVEAYPDCIRFVTNPVSEAVIIGSLVDFTENGHLIIGKEVSSLIIISEEIRSSQVNKIVYEDCQVTPLPRSAMVPDRAATGMPNNDRNVYTPNGGNRGRDGGCGADGLNGGEPGFDGDVVGPAPDVTIYVLHTPEGLPTVEIGGRRGGQGQPGQHGGHGGDGARGRPSSTSFWGECLRGVGTGGDGGDGGSGGSGGIGGVGGSGGHLKIITLDDNLELLWPVPSEHFIDNTGGAGGNGGFPGIGGDGGVGGAPGEANGFCDEENRVGKSGVLGKSGSSGANGPTGAAGSFQTQPITFADWNALFRGQWLRSLTPWEGNVGQNVRVEALNITDETVVLFDNLPIEPINRNVEAGILDFTVPSGIIGGRHNVQLRIPGVNGYVYTNIVTFRVLPYLARITPGNGVPGTLLTLEGTGFTPGAFVRFGDRSFPTNFDSNIKLKFKLPDHENIGTGAGKKDVAVVNPDGYNSNMQAFDLTSDIIVRVKAWLVYPDIIMGGSPYGGPGPERDVDDVKHLFCENTTPRRVWLDHFIALEFDPVVGDATVPADWGDSWPSGDDVSFEEIAAVIKAKDDHGNYLHFEEGAVNFYFVDDIDDWTTHAYTYRGAENHRQEFIIYEDTPFLSHWEEAHVAAHELGHVFGLPHVCGIEGDVTFHRICADSDVSYLMYPSTNLFLDEGNTLTSEEARIARKVARLWHNL